MTNYRHVYPQPFVKWAGGKGQILAEISRILPRRYNRYYEPFLGGGALFFHLQPAAATISDSNYELVNAYRVVRNNLSQLVDLLRELQGRVLSRPLFDRYKKMDPEKLTLVQRAARFIFLNKTCYNGLYRVNKNGEFNVPIGKYRAMPTLFDERNLVEVQRVLRRTDIVCDNYENVLQDARKDDLIYLDPPYSKGSAQAFVSYTKEPFSNYDQQKLAAGFRELDRRGCLLLLSNSDTDAVRDLYEDYADRTTRILADRSINSVGFNRTGYAEVLITNYTRFLETLTRWVK